MIMYQIEKNFFNKKNVTKYLKNIKSSEKKHFFVIWNINFVAFGS